MRQGGDAAASQLSWPASPADIPGFADAAARILRSTLSLTPGAGYSWKYCLRKLLVVLEDSLGPAMLDDVVVQRAANWFPDMGNHMAPFHSWTGYALRRRMGCSALWAATWSCFCGDLAASEVAALRLSALFQASAPSQRRGRQG